MPAERIVERHGGGDYAADALGYPVVAKLYSDGVAHKTRGG